MDAANSSETSATSGDDILSHENATAAPTHSLDPPTSPPQFIDSSSVHRRRTSANMSTDSTNSQDNANSSQPTCDEPAVCWICSGDETEDSPGQLRRWRTPCRCGLKAHEDCLLTWARHNVSPFPKDLRCPMCQQSIVISRPLGSPLLLLGLPLVLSQQWRIPRMLLLNELKSLFWKAHSAALLSMPLFGEQQTQFVVRNDVVIHFMAWYTKGLLALLGLQCSVIPERRHYLFPSSLLLVLGNVLYDPAKSLSWPPGDILLMSSLPWIQSAYRYSWDKFLQPLNLNLEQELRALGIGTERLGPNNSGGDDQERPNGTGVDIIRENVNAANAEAEQRGQQAPQAAPPPQPGNVPPVNRVQRRIQPANLEMILYRRQIDALNLADVWWLPWTSSVLAFGLKQILPASWTTVADPLRGPTGILQKHFGRVVVAGLLSFVIADTAKLLYKYSLVQSRKEWTVRDYRPPSPEQVNEQP